MKVKFTHLGTVLTNSDPLLGFYVHDYICEDESGRIEKIRDEDYLPDGVYDVGEDFFDKYAPQCALREDEW